MAIVLRPGFLFTKKSWKVRSWRSLVRENIGYSVVDVKIKDVAALLQ